MAEQAPRRKSSSRSGSSSRSKSAATRNSSSSKGSSSSSKSATRTSSSRSSSSRKPSATKKRAAKKPVGVRPAILFSLALACVVAVGVFSIKAIHASTPQLAGFEFKQAEAPESTLTNEGPTGPPESAKLMQTQGWIAPAALELYEPGRRRSALPPEIAAVPETLIEARVANPLGYGFEPPPPIEGTLANNGISLENGQPFPSQDAVIIQGGDAGTTATPEESPDKIESMIAGINNQGATPAPKPQTQQPAQTSLLQAQSACADKGFIARIACNDRVRDLFCSGRWNETAGCERDEDANF